jgi:DEAD/DEAH box helicase domain-containing protein
MDLDQKALRQSLKQKAPNPQWLSESMGKLAIHPDLGKVKITGFLATVVSVEKQGDIYQVDAETLTLIEETESLDLSQIKEPLFRELAFLWSDRLIHLQTVKGQEGQLQDITSRLNQEIKKALLKLGIKKLYSHQVEAIEAYFKGESVVLLTPTGSGKSYCFFLPSFDICLSQHKTILLIYPLKALINDQYNKLLAFNEALSPEKRLWIAKCTGDVPKKERDKYWKGVKYPDIVLISPDVLHYQLAHSNSSYHRQWQQFLGKLALVVCDEAHSYISAFGIHLANLMRRLRLASENQGGNFQWMVSTATIGNPMEFAEKLTGVSSEELRLIDKSGAKTYERTLLILEPSNAPNFTVVNLMVELLAKGLKGLVFVNSRHTVKYLYSLLAERRKTAEVEMFYGSLWENKRRQLISSLDGGRLKALISTSALQAGIDLKSVDYVIIRGLDSLNDFWQRAGRCGRGNPGLIIFVPDGMDLIDDYYARHPEELIKNIEKIKLNPNYPPILAKHLLCAAKDTGIPSAKVTDYFGEKADVLAAELVKQKQINWSRNQILWTRDYHHSQVYLRGIMNQNVSLVNQQTGDVMEEIAENFAYREAHQEAIYHLSQNGEISHWRVESLDVVARTAVLIPLQEKNHFTRPKMNMKVLPKSLLEHRIVK